MAAPTTPTTELEAVNMMLRALGEAPVTALGGSQQDLATAEQILDEEVRKLCAEGWYWNTDIDVELSESGGTIAVPSDALFVDPMSSAKNVTVRDVSGSLFLYDRDNNTTTWATGTTIKCKVVRALEFIDLQQTARDYVALRAAHRLVKFMMGEEGMVNFIEQDMLEARLHMEKDEDDHADHNMANSADMRNMMSRYRDAGHIWYN